MEVQVIVKDADNGIARQYADAIFAEVSKQCKQFGCPLVETKYQYNDVSVGSCSYVQLTATSAT